MLYLEIKSNGKKYSRYEGLLKRFDHVPTMQFIAHVIFNNTLLCTMYIDV